MLEEQIENWLKTSIEKNIICYDTEGEYGFITNRLLRILEDNNGKPDIIVIDLDNSARNLPHLLWTGANIIVCKINLIEKLKRLVDGFYIGGEKKHLFIHINKDNYPIIAGY